MPMNKQDRHQARTQMYPLQAAFLEDLERLVSS